MSGSFIQFEISSGSQEPLEPPLTRPLYNDAQYHYHRILGSIQTFIQHAKIGEISFKKKSIETSFLSINAVNFSLAPLSKKNLKGILVYGKGDRNLASYSFLNGAK